MPTLELRFPAGRYHATPWGSHVNEGVIEWPPAPWRLLRALLSVGYTHLQWSGSRPPAVAQQLIEKLAAVQPLYQLPPASGAHSRHYMPRGGIDKERGVEETTLVFDTWANVGPEPLLVQWDADLTAKERGLLGELAERLGYLGRSESWVNARLVDNAEPAFNAVPCQALPTPPAGREQVAVLSTISAAHYLEWRESETQSLLQKAPKPAAVKRLPKDANAAQKQADAEMKAARKVADKAHKAALKAVENDYPKDLIDCLQTSTNWLQSCGWSRPPGSQKIFYWRPNDHLKPSPPSRARTQASAPPVEAMLLAINTRSRSAGALPSIYRTLNQAALLHQAFASQKNRSHGEPAPQVLTGCDASGAPLRHAHQHAHILPLDLDGDHQLDHVLVWASMGLDAAAQKVIRAVRRTYGKKQPDPLQVSVAGYGPLEKIMQARQAPSGLQMPPLFVAEPGATHWRSLTPFVPPRFLKNNGKNSLAGQVNQELLGRSLPALKNLRVVQPDADDQARSARHYSLRRNNGRAPKAERTFVLELELEHPATGPLALGYGSHLGLGLFRALPD